MEIEYPPYTITDKMLNLATSIMEKIMKIDFHFNNCFIFFPRFSFNNSIVKRTKMCDN